MGLLEPKVTRRKKLKRSRTSLDPMDIVKGRKIQLGDNLLDEVGTRRSLLSLGLCHMVLCIKNHHVGRILFGLGLSPWTQFELELERV